MAALFIFLIIVFVIAGIIASCYFTYFIVKPYLQTKDGRKLALKYFLILAVIAWGGAALAWYLNRQPAYFEQGIEQLHTSKYITEKMGDFSSYTLNSNKIIKEPISPAVFQVEINSDSLNLFLTCTMSKIKEKWVLVYIKQDSVRINKQ